MNIDFAGTSLGWAGEAETGSLQGAVAAEAPPGLTPLHARQEVELARVETMGDCLGKALGGLRKLTDLGELQR